MNRFMRYLSALMCLALIMTGLPVFAETVPEATPDQTVVNDGEEDVAVPAAVEATATASAAPTATTEPETWFYFKNDVVNLDLRADDERKFIDALDMVICGNEKKAAFFWITSDSEVASVFGDQVCLYGEGTATLTAILITNRSIEKQVTVNVTEGMKIIGPDYAREGTGAEFSLKYLDGTEIDANDVEWSSSDKNIATIVKGQASFRRAGSVTFTAKYGKKEATITYNVLSMYDPEPTVTAAPTTPAPGEPTAAPGTAVPGTAAPTAAPTVKPGPTVKFSSDKKSIDRSVLAGGNAAKLLGLELSEVKETDIVWTSSDSDVARVSDGLMFSGKTGKTTIRAAHKDDPTVFDEIELTVTFDYKISGLNSCIIGQSITLELYTMNDMLMGNSFAEWSSSDETIATVSDDGVVTGIKPGTVSITVKYNGIVHMYSVTVPEPSIPFTATDVNIFSNGTGRLVLTTTIGEEVDYSKVSYVFPDKSAEDHFTIGENGVITPIVNEEGELATYDQCSFEVQAYYGGCTASATVTIRQAALNYFIGIDKETIELFEGCDYDYLGISYYPNSTHDYPVSYVSTDENVFTCDTINQTIRGVKKGSAELIVTMRSGSVFRIPVEVKVPITSLELEQPEAFFRVGESFVINAIAKPMNAEHPIYWSTSSSDVATVDDNGRVTCKAEGYAKISAYSIVPGVSDSVEIYVVKPVEKIEFYKGIIDNKTEFTIAQGKTFLPVIDVFPKDATLAGYAMTSSNSAVVQFTEAGKIIGVGVGTAVVEFISLDGYVSRSITVNVVPKKYVVSSFKLSSSSVTLGEGASKTITPKFNSSAYDKKVTWVSDSPGIATVDANGRITAVAPGKATIYAMCSTGAYKSVKVTVNVQKPTGVKLNVTKGSIYPGEEYQFKATVQPTTIVREEMKVVKWKSSNTKVAIVNDEGHLFAIAPGTATITVTTVNGKKATCKVTVKKRPVSSVEIVAPYTEFIVGGTYDLDAKVSPENAYNTAVTWSSSSKSVATINSSTGVMTCKKAGTVKITAKAKDGSGKKKVITIKVVNLPLKSMSVTRDGNEITKDSVISLPYGETLTIAAVSDPAMYVEYKSSDERIATVKDGVITATGSGKAKITVTFGGSHARAFYVDVPYSADAPRYRALVISQYSTQGKSGFLPFSSNSSSGIVNALQLSDLEGSRYEVTHKRDLATTEAVQSAIRTTFANAKEGDVSVVYIMTHATITNGVFRWHLTKKNGKTVYMYPQDVMNTLKEIKGDVVLMVLSCKSGGDVENAENLTGMVRDIDKKAAAGSSYSVICASEGTMRASYANTDPSFSYDFFTYGLCQSLGWDMRKSKEAATSADANADGVITLKEFAQATQVFTREECAAFIAKYGTSAYFGPAEQKQEVSYYISPNAGEVKVFAK